MTTTSPTPSGPTPSGPTLTMTPSQNLTKELATSTLPQHGNDSAKVPLRTVLLRSNRVILGCALLLAIVLPELVHPSLNHLGRFFANRHPDLPVEPGMIFACAALIAGHIALQQTGVLPLVSARSLILPTFLATYGSVAIGIYALRLPIGQYHLWTSFLIALAWYFIVAMLRARHIRPIIGVIKIPRRHFASLPKSSIIWQELKEPVLTQRVDGVVVDPHSDITIEWSRFLTDLVLKGVPVYHRAYLEERITGQVYFSSHADNDFGMLIPSQNYNKIKHAMDFGLALVVFPFALVLTALCAVAIRLESRGPALFIQERTGYRGETFRCYKLRTMRTDIEGPSFTTEDDPRVTRLGRFLRKYRIDELPQILNILMGEMSWIGPRPEAVALASEYSLNVPFYDYRHAVRPGISGWAAVHQGNVAEVEAATRKLGYDFFYIKHFSFWLDFLIAIKTVRTVLSGFGSR